MRYSLLDLTQIILASMDSDEINSITDSTEAQQVVSVIKTAYYDIVAKANFPRDYSLFQLSPSLDPLKPVTMSLPSNVEELGWIKYNMATAANPEYYMQPVARRPLEDFLAEVLSLDPSAANTTTYTVVIDGQTMTLQCQNDRPPYAWTTFDDNTVLFNAYQADIEDTLQGSKTLCYGQKGFPWQNVDTFVPPLDDKQHQLLLNEAKALAFMELKQTQHPKAEKNSRQLWIDQQASKHRIALKTGLQKTPNFGR